AFAAGAQPPAPNLEAKVKGLIGQLAAPGKAAQDEAEVGLLRLGPDALPQLRAHVATVEPKSVAGQRLRAVIDALQELKPRTFTLEREAITLDEALKELAAQTSIPVANKMGRRPGPKFALKCKGCTFWHGVDAIAAAAGARVSPYAVEGQVALVD